LSRNKKLLYIIAAIILISIIGIFFKSCHLSNLKTPKAGEDTVINNVAAKKTTKNSKKVIGISVMNYINEYWLDLVDGVKVYSADQGYEVDAVQVNDSVDEQVKSINNFVDKGVDGIIVATINEKALEPSIKKAMNSGIKIIAHLHDLKDFNVLYGPKEYEMGFIAGRYMGKLLKDKSIENPKLAMLTQPEIANQIDRQKGIEDGLREFVPEAVIVAKEAGSTPDMGKSAATKIITKNPNLNGFVGINDNGLLGALEVSREMGLSKRSDFLIVGIGGDSAALNVIKDDTSFKATVNIDPWLNGYNEANLMKEMFDGNHMIGKVIYFSPLTIVDKSNVNDVIFERSKRGKLFDKKEN
jgi:ABC-type sugar transport system substrate-binding protein